MLEIAGWTLSFDYKESNVFSKLGFLQCPQNMGYRKWLQQWAFFYTRKFKFTMKMLHSGWLCLLGENLEILAMFSLA